MNIPRLYSDDGNEIAKSYVSVKHRIGGKTDNSFYANRTYTLNKGEYEYSLKFNEAGEFYVGFGFLINGTSTFYRITATLRSRLLRIRIILFPTGF